MNRNTCEHGIPSELNCNDCGDAINPSHYKSHPSGVECIEITEHMTFCLGNAIKYIWRAGLKSNDPTEDLEKARWYLAQEISRIQQLEKALQR